MGKLSELKSLFDEYGIDLNEELFEQLYNAWIFIGSNIEFYNFCEIILKFIVINDLVKKKSSFIAVKFLNSTFFKHSLRLLMKNYYTATFCF